MKRSSWKTTLGGVGGLVVALIALLTVVSGFLNGEPITLTQAIAVIGGISTAVTGFSARDNNVTSRDAGAE